MNTSGGFYASQQACKSPALTSAHNSREHAEACQQRAQRRLQLLKSQTVPLW